MGKLSGKAIVVVLTGALIMSGGCSRNSPSDIFQKVEGTEDIDIYGTGMSMSPDGRFIIFLTDGVEEWRSGEKKDYGIASVDLISGKVVEHHPSENMAPEVREHLEERRYVNGLKLGFNEVGWCGREFFLSSGRRWLRFDPTETSFMETMDRCPKPGLQCSDRIPQEILKQRIERYRSQGGMLGSKRFNFGGMPNNGSQYSVSFAVSGVDSFVYYGGRGENNHRLYRSDGVVTEEFYAFKKGWFRPQILQIRLSPHGRFLAVIYERKLNKPIPSSGGGYVLSIFDLVGENDPFKWRIDNLIGSCIWSPSGDELYVSTAPRGDGIYRLRLKDVWN